MSGPSTYQPQNGFLKWLEQRLPIGGGGGATAGLTPQV